MNELIKINPDGRTTSKELYEFLGLDQSNYAKWCKANIVNNGFAEENMDWGLLVLHDEKLNYRPSQNYWLTIAFAKKLCMISPTERGEQARNYFIEVEKRLERQSKLIALPDFTNPAIAARAWADEVEQKMLAEAQVKELKPKADTMDMLTDKPIDNMDFELAAKTLRLPNIGPKKLRLIAREIKDLTARGLPTMQAERDGYYIVIQAYVPRLRKYESQVLVTPKGIHRLRGAYQRLYGDLFQ